MKFLCDEMLGGLARWLRAAGYDAAMMARGTPDRDLVERARTEGRVLLTRDAALPQIKGAGAVTHVLRTPDLTSWAHELARELGVDWLARPFTRCLVCNVTLGPATDAQIARLPDDARTAPGPFRACPACGRVYWPGSHVKRMTRRLEAFAGLRPHSTP